jgi:tetratricopeptide (TPR) repeat protein
MSLFIDVTEPLSGIVKEKLNGIIENEKKDQPKPIRRICETCSKYLEYGELRYDKMEDGISELNESADISESLYILLMAVMNESLDEDLKALELLQQLSETHSTRDFRQELGDFITLGKFATLGQFELLEDAGSIIIERYSDKNTITDTLSNMYLKVDNDDCIPVIHNLLARAKTKFPDLLALESLTGFMQIKAKDYQSALTTFTGLRDRIAAQADSNPYINDNLASVWDNISLCYMNLGDAEKTIEACNTAIEYDVNAVAYNLGLPVLYRKGEALLLAGKKEEAVATANQILAEFPEDEMATDIMNRAS